jgi:hypothetical protein
LLFEIDAEALGFLLGCHGGRCIGLNQTPRSSPAAF